ncbi:MAG TPA: sigma-54 dependent transcriptional regulator [Candidatus Mailhella merdavium]|nr:sigma-54 dependent transcriptional regulator [Candidatus Mailhella merdavium]
MSTQRLLFLAPAQAVTRIFPQLRDAGFEVALAENLKGATAFVRKSAPGLIFSRPAMPGFQVEELLAAGADAADFPPVIVISERGTAEEARRLMGLGARDYWLEPLSVEKIVAAAREPRPAPPAPPHSTLGGHRPEPGRVGKYGSAPHIVGSHPAIRRVLALARQVAPSRATVLLSGESGTGKEMFARTLHAWSDRADGPFIAVNCAALPEHLLESELFGHEKGAFTGAIARKPGKFELADGGTILLDEISEMELGLQAKLLRVLQEGEIDRVGGTESVKVNVRVIATTNRNLEEWVREGKFRQDLFFRLNVIPLRLPSLKERGNDVLELARFFMDMYVREYGLPPAELSPEARNWLLSYDWPGNVRELQNLMERAVLLAGGRPIMPGHFLLDPDAWPLFSEEESGAVAADGAEYGSTDGKPGSIEGTESPSGEESGEHVPRLPEKSGDSPEHLFSGAVIPLHEMERIMIMKGLSATDGNRTQAAELLGISVRTLRNKLNEYRGMGLDIEEPGSNSRS